MTANKKDLIELAEAALRIELRNEFFALQQLVDGTKDEALACCFYIREMAAFLERLTPQEREMLREEIYWCEIASLYKRLAHELALAAEAANWLREFAENQGGE